MHWVVSSLINTQTVVHVYNTICVSFSCKSHQWSVGSLQVYNGGILLATAGHITTKRSLLGDVERCGIKVDHGVGEDDVLRVLGRLGKERRGNVEVPGSYFVVHKQGTL